MAKDAAYDTDNLSVTFFNKNRVLEGAVPLLKTITRERPHIVMSSIGHLNTLVGCLSIFFPKIKFIGREASVISVLGEFSKKKSFLNKNILYKFAYKRMDTIVCQSQDMYDDFKRIYGLSDMQMALIANPAPENMHLTEKREGLLKSPRFITIGRLSPEKGHVRILNCLAKIDYSFLYTIIGSGPEEGIIKEEVKRLGLSDYVNFIPFTKKINEQLITHDVFLQGSYVEGFPNALIESCVSGVPVLAFKAPGGTKEIIENGTNGFLVVDEKEFIDKLYKIMERNWNPEAIRESVYKKYKAPVILKKYETMFNELLKYEG